MSAPFAARSTKTIERMAKERSQASFPVREMTYFLDGGKGMTELKVCHLEGFGGWGDWIGLVLRLELRAWVVCVSVPARTTICSTMQDLTLRRARMTMPRRDLTDLSPPIIAGGDDAAAGGGPGVCRPRVARPLAGRGAWVSQERSAIVAFVWSVLCPVWRHARPTKPPLPIPSLSKSTSHSPTLPMFFLP